MALLRCQSVSQAVTCAPLVYVRRGAHSLLVGFADLVEQLAERREALTSLVYNIIKPIERIRRSGEMRKAQDGAWVHRAPST